jgi:hypothetical protein
MFIRLELKVSFSILISVDVFGVGMRSQPELAAEGILRFWSSKLLAMKFEIPWWDLIQISPF